MHYRKTVTVSLLALLLLSGCGQMPVCQWPAKPILSELGPDMQEIMELQLNPIGSSTTQPNARLIGGNGSY